MLPQSPHATPHLFIYRFAEEMINLRLMRPAGQGFASGHPDVVLNGDLHRAAIVVTKHEEHSSELTTYERGHVLTDAGHYSSFRLVNNQQVESFHLTEPNLMNAESSPLHEQIVPWKGADNKYDPLWAQHPKRWYQQQHDAIDNNLAMTLDFIPLI